MNQTLLSIIQITYSTAFPLIMGYVVKTIKDIKEAKDAGKQADMLILRLILIDMHDKYTTQGYISRNAYDTFDEVWELYTNKYKGNHLTQRFKEEVNELEIRG